MKSITSAIYIETGSNADLARLATSVNGKLKKDIITIDEQSGKGTIRKAELENGLSLYIWNCSFLNSFTLCYYTAPANIARVCNLAYNLSPGSIIPEYLAAPGTRPLPWADTFFINNSSCTVFSFRPRKNIQLVHLSITKEWLFRHFDHQDSALRESLEKYTERTIEPIVSICLPEEFTVASEIFEDRGTNSMFVQSRVCLLLSFFFEKLLSPKQDTAEYFAYFRKVRKVKSILNQHLQSTLPSIYEIAGQVDMCESALKRYFKLIYGHNIYEYYLQQKMELAKRMLIDENINVSEVAWNLKYESVSSFIGIFKSQFGYPPGHIRKTRQVH